LVVLAIGNDIREFLLYKMRPVSTSTARAALAVREGGPLKVRSGVLSEPVVELCAIATGTNAVSDKTKDNKSKKQNEVNFSWDFERLNFLIYSSATHLNFSDITTPWSYFPNLNPHMHQGRLAVGRLESAFYTLSYFKPPVCIWKNPPEYKNVKPVFNNSGRRNCFTESFLNPQKEIL
jgi:hypothetical protein